MYDYITIECVIRKQGFDVRDNAASTKQYTYTTNKILKKEDVKKQI